MPRVEGIAWADRRDSDRNALDSAGHGSRIQACVMPAGGAGVSDVGLVNECWIG